MHDKTSTGTPEHGRDLSPPVRSAPAPSRAEDAPAATDRRHNSITVALRVLIGLITAAVGTLVVYLFWVITMMGGGWYLLVGTVLLCAPAPVLHLITRLQNKQR
ncbi:hypothetical protein ABZV24_13480 [Streptomyces sp. NPDC005251]|uniref:hypothetical protein n=1 Tax=Streptomyces sp. NPDC005251 TaxID=3157166 RepID=UPI0033BF2B1D